MARQRTLLVNIERMRREMDELLGEGWVATPAHGQGGGFSPRVDVYYAREEERAREGADPREGEPAHAAADPRRATTAGQSGGGAPQGPEGTIAVVTIDLAGVGADAVSLEVSGRVLVVSGKRPVRETAGRAYQQVEIPTGAFRRAIELDVEVDADRARATFEDGLLRVELPVRLPASTARTVPIEGRSA